MQKNSVKIFAALLMAGCSAVAVQAKVVPARVFSDHMVLQREMKVPVWGKADPGEKVTVEFAGQKLEGVAGKDGKWRIDLAPLKAAAEGSVMKITGKDNAVEIKDVLVGEVWLCGGQSNMYQPMWGPRANYRQYNGNELARTANYPKIRFVQMPKQLSFVPAPELIKDYAWKAIAPDTVEPTSAVAFFFGRELHAKLNVPIGLIQSSWGGSRIEPWISLEGYRAVPQGAELGRGVEARTPGSALNKQITAKLLNDISRWQKRARAAATAGKLPPPPPAYPKDFQRVGSRDNTTPASLYNSMILPFVPYAVRGAIWYQGCSNLSDGYNYIWKLDALYKSWSTVFENPGLKFYIVQLAPHIYGGKYYRFKAPRVKSTTDAAARFLAEKLPTIQYAQQLYADSNPNAGLVVVTDVGNLEDIHPGDKTKVGLRLANLALKNDYGMKEINAEAPRVSGRRIEGGKVIISFKNTAKWISKTGKAPAQFEIAGADGIFHKADAEISGTDIIVSSAKVSDPQRVTYGWSHYFEAELTNEADHPVGPFSLDLLTFEQKIEQFRKCGRLVYEYDLLGGSTAKVVKNNSADTGKFSRINYLLIVTDKKQKTDYVFASIGAFTGDPRKIGIPLNREFTFNQSVKDLRYESSISSVGSGFSANGVAEITGYNYSTKLSKGLNGASEKYFDFDDNFVQKGSYGCFQIHDPSRRLTVFAYNNFRKGPRCDIGIGNNPRAAVTGKGHPDWTFSGSGRNYASARLYISVE